MANPGDPSPADPAPASPPLPSSPGPAPDPAPGTGPSPGAPAPAAAPAPSPVSPAATDSPAPASAAPAPSSTPAAPPAPAAPGRPPPDRVRSNIRVAAVVMVALGALMAFQYQSAAALGDHQVTDAEARSAADGPGWLVKLDVVGASNAPVRVYHMNGTLLENRTTDANGHLEFQMPKAAARVEVDAGNATASRNILTWPLWPTEARIDPADPGANAAWALPDLTPMRGFWVVVGAGVFMIVAGVMAFRLRGPRIALAGAVVFFLAGVGLALWNSAVFGVQLRVLFDPLLKMAMGAFAIWAVRKGWDRFQPVQLGPVSL